MSDDDDDDKVVNILDLNKDGMSKNDIPGITGAAGIGPCFVVVGMDTSVEIAPLEIDQKTD